jgi:hypothetical protein
MICPVVRYVNHDRVEDYLRLGWMHVADLLLPHSIWAVLMGWPCQCRLVEPVGEQE